MIYIVCDMNCNNFGNYFKIVGDEHSIREDNNSFIIANTYYPKGYCYKVKGISPFKTLNTIKYSEAIDYLIPEDYVKWMKKRFKGEII